MFFPVPTEHKMKAYVATYSADRGVVRHGLFVPDMGHRFISETEGSLTIIDTKANESLVHIDKSVELSPPEWQVIQELLRSAPSVIKIIKKHSGS